MKIPHKNLIFNLIDTPIFGDTKWIAENKENIKNYTKNLWSMITS